VIPINWELNKSLTEVSENNKARILANRAMARTLLAPDKTTKLAPGLEVLPRVDLPPASVNLNEAILKRSFDLQHSSKSSPLSPADQQAAKAISKVLTNADLYNKVHLNNFHSRYGNRNRFTPPGGAEIVVSAQSLKSTSVDSLIARDTGAAEQSSRTPIKVSGHQAILVRSTELFDKNTPMNVVSAYVEDSDHVLHKYTLIYNDGDPRSMEHEKAFEQVLASAEFKKPTAMLKKLDLKPSADGESDIVQPINPIGATLIKPVIRASQINEFLSKQYENRKKDHPGKPRPGLDKWGEGFLAYAKQFCVDPKLIVAIAGAETQFGYTPKFANNAWNWFFRGPEGKPSDMVSYEEGIKRVSNGMRIYANRYALDTVEEIGERYCKEGCEHWVSNVSSFLQTLNALGNGNPAPEEQCPLPTTVSVKSPSKEKLKPTVQESKGYSFSLLVDWLKKWWKRITA
jgi:hypothetical protein